MKSDKFNIKLTAAATAIFISVMAFWGLDYFKTLASQQNLKTCSNPISLDTDGNGSVPISSIDLFTNSGTGTLAIKSIRFFVENTSTGDSVDIETIIPDKIRDSSGELTSFEQIEQKVVCDDIRIGGIESAILSPVIPDLIKNQNGKYHGLIRVISPYFTIKSVKANKPNFRHYPDEIGNIQMPDKRPSSESNIYNMFKMKNGFYGHETKFFKLPLNRIEMRNSSKPYTNIKRHISVIYELRSYHSK